MILISDKLPTPSACKTVKSLDNGLEENIQPDCDMQHGFICQQGNMFIILTPQHYAYFEQFDWLEKKFYTSINSISRNLGTIFLQPAPKMCNTVDKNKILTTK